MTKNPGCVSHRRVAFGGQPCGIRLLVWAVIFVLGLWSGTTTRAQAWLDWIDDSLFLQSKNGVFRVDLSGTIDLEAYYIDQRPPGLIFGDGEDFINPRLSLFLEATAGKHFYSFAQARFDRGFDPRSEPQDARFDEYFLRYIPFDDARLNFQVGKFSTVIGNWVPRHLSWDNPFINAPLPYERVTAAADESIVPDPDSFLARRDLPDRKELWQPVIWGPSYASGVSAFGNLSQFDYAIEIKNSSISSRPASWDGIDINWENPTFSGRLGYRPGAAWALGASFSQGTYLRPDAESMATFPAGKEIDDFHQITFAHDASFAWHDLQIWAEVFLSRFEVPNVGDADVVAYYVEAKYKITPQLFAALRWNQELFDEVRNGVGARTPWDRHTWRTDVAFGYRFTRHFQTKVQYSYNHQNGTLQQGEQLVAGQITFKF